MSSVLKYRLIIDTAKPQLRCFKKQDFSDILGTKPKRPLMLVWVPLLVSDLTSKISPVVCYYLVFLEGAEK